MKIFRKIRQQLVTDNKVSKYLLYAIGEIILVVIGILIALNINNRNKEVSNRNAELNFYNNTKQQLLDDLNNIESNMEYNTKYAKQFRYAVNLIELKDKSKKDSLGKIAVNILTNSDFDRQGNIYETMVNSGDVKLLKNNKIIQGLRRLEETYIYVNRMEKIHFEALMSMVPDLIQTIRLYSKKVENEDYLYGLRFQNYFVLSLKVMDEKNSAYKRTKNEIKSIIKLIEIELE
jgi:predicted HTH domain antitoxin